VLKVGAFDLSNYQSVFSYRGNDVGCTLSRSHPEQLPGRRIAGAQNRIAASSEVIYHRLFSQVSFQLYITMIWVHMYDGPLQKGRSIIQEFNDSIKLAAKTSGQKHRDRLVARSSRFLAGVRTQRPGKATSE